MHGSCAPPPCPPPDCSTPLGDWGGAGALDALNEAYAEQSTNASGLDDSVPGIIIDDGGLGGDGSTITTVLEIAGDVVLPATAAAAAATGIIGLAALGKIIASINRHIRSVKGLDQRLALLASHAVDLHKDLTREQQNGVNDEWLKGDIAKAETVLKNVETYCAKLSKQGFVKRYITQSKNRKDKLDHLIVQFEAMRANLTTVSVLAMRRFMVDVVGPKMDRIEGSLETVTDALVQVKISQSQSAHASSENISTTVTSETSTTKTTAATKNKLRVKRSSKSKSRRAKVEEAEDDQEAEPKSHSPPPSRQYHSEENLKATYASDSSHHQRATYQEYHVGPQYYPDVQQDWSGTWSQHDGQQKDGSDWQPCSEEHYVDDGHSDSSYYQSSSDGYFGDNDGAYSYGYNRGGDGSVSAIHDQAAQMEEQARRMERQAHQRAQSMERGGWQTRNAAHHKAHAMRENALRRAEAAKGQRMGSNLSVNSWGSETTVYNSIDNSMHNNSSVQYGNVVTTNSYNY